MAGNAFHTAVECMVRRQQQDTFGLGQEAFKFFTDATYNPAFPTAPPTTWGQGTLGYWVDDYGWWGNAFIYSYNNADALGYSSDFKDSLLLNAKNCWEALHACWNPTPISEKDEKGTPYTITGGIPNTSEALYLCFR
jgi:hypothetical protein